MVKPKTVVVIAVIALLAVAVAMRIPKVRALVLGA